MPEVREFRFDLGTAPARSYLDATITMDEVLGRVSMQRGPWTCMHCDTRIDENGRCGCWWRWLPVVAQSFVLDFVPVPERWRT